MTLDERIPEEHSTSDIERFFCIHCGYDLTGHSGDTRRCPECGQSTSMEELEVALLIQKRGVPAYEPAVIPSLFILFVVVFGIPSWFPGCPTGWRAIAALSVIVWISGLIFFHLRYGHHYDKWVFLGESHFVVVVVPTAPFAVMGSVLYMIFRGMNAEGSAILALGSLSIGLATLAYRDMKRRLPAYRLPKPSKITAEQ